MHHVAIMRKSWNLIPKILSGDKQIESRWYKSKFAPWNKIKAGDVVFFKDSGASVSAKAIVSRVLQFENYSSSQLKEILLKYGDKIKFTNSSTALKFCSQKRHCILVFLSNPKPVKPFNIDKSGFGNACAWLCVGDVNKIRS